MIRVPAEAEKTITPVLPSVKKSYGNSGETTIAVKWGRKRGSLILLRERRDDECVKCLTV